jgi:hypothetical protein
MKTFLWMAVSLIPLLAGCHHEAPHAMDPLVFPPVSEIEEITVIRLKPDGGDLTEFEIHDPQKIEEVLAELQSNNTGYLSDMEGRAPQEYAVAFDTRESMAAMAWIGPDWFGGVDEHQEEKDGGLASHYRKLDEEQHKRLLILLRQPEVPR